MICGCPNCKPYQQRKQKSSLRIASLGEFNPRMYPDFVQKIVGYSNSNRYMEAINGARKMRTEAFDKVFDWDHTKRFPFLIKNMFGYWWDYAHYTYSDRPISLNMMKNGN